MAKTPDSKIIPKSTAVKLVLLLGVISLFSDMVTEGARSITGPYLGLLGASGAAVGFIAGFGELIGNLLRIGSGYVVDRTSKYWSIIFIGYLINLLTLPLLAFVGNWQLAGLLIIAERIGKAIRTPARDAMLSYASQKIGRGWGFGLHQALDQMGAMLGPLMILIILAFTNDYRIGFISLSIPGILTMILWFRTRKLYPHPQDLEIPSAEIKSQEIPSLFWIYLIGIGFVAAGYADFPLVAFHFAKNNILSPRLIVFSYVVAMGFSGLSALFFGWMYDRIGCSSLIITILLSSLFAPLVFLGGTIGAFVGMILWGIGIGAQRSLIKAVIGDMVSKKIRGSAFGIFNAGYGFAWFLGSVLLGILYDISIPSLIAFSVISQLCAIPFIFIVQKKLK